MQHYSGISGYCTLMPPSAIVRGLDAIEGARKQKRKDKKKRQRLVRSYRRVLMQQFCDHTLQSTEDLLREGIKVYDGVVSFCAGNKEVRPAFPDATGEFASSRVRTRARDDGSPWTLMRMYQVSMAVHQNMAFVVTDGCTVPPSIATDFIILREDALSGYSAYESNEAAIETYGMLYLVATDLLAFLREVRQECGVLCTPDAVPTNPLSETVFGKVTVAVDNCMTTVITEKLQTIDTLAHLHSDVVSACTSLESSLLRMLFAFVRRALRDCFNELLHPEEARYKVGVPPSETVYACDAH